MTIEDARLNVTIAGWTYGLDALIARPADAAGPRPLAIITHGSPRSPADRANRTARSMITQARDLAYRGWVAVAFVRRGFGRSDGPFAEGYNCDAPNFTRSLSIAAQDIEAVRAVASRMPGVDGTHVLGMGTSVGGASMLAWAATKPAGLVGIINLSGGTGSSAPGLNCDENGLVSTFASFGEDVRVPTLWFYAQNDTFFGPALVQRLYKAFTRGGGTAELVTFGPVGKDGHEITTLFDGRLLWEPVMDRFLRQHSLPTWDATPFQALSARLAPEAQRVLTRYLAGSVEKALSLSRTKGIARWWSGVDDLETARTKSLEVCERDAGEPCDVAVEDFTPVR